MSRIPPVDPTTAPPKVRELLAGVQKSLGATPNLYRVIGQSPAALQGVLDLTGALARGRIGARLREQIALAVAEANACYKISPLYDPFVDAPYPCPNINSDIFGLAMLARDRCPATHKCEVYELP